MLPGEFEVTGGRFANAKMQGQKLARRIVDIDVERAAWSAIFEPGVMRAIDLGKFAAARPAIA